MAITLLDAQKALMAHGFRQQHFTSKLSEYQSDNNGKVIYLYLNQGFPHHADLVVHPDTDVALLTAIRDVKLNTRVAFRFGSHMRRFPKRLNNGQKPEHFGKALHISTAQALASLCKKYG